MILDPEMLPMASSVAPIEVTRARCQLSEFGDAICLQSETGDEFAVISAEAFRDGSLQQGEIAFLYCIIYLHTPSGAICARLFRHWSGVAKYLGDLATWSHWIVRAREPRLN